MVTLKSDKSIKSTLMDTISVFSDIKGDKKPYLKQLKIDLEPYGGINFIGDMIMFKLQIAKLFVTYNLGELYKEMRDGNFFETPPMVKILDTKREAHNIMGQVINVINLNLKMRSKKNLYAKADLASDSNSSSCMCSSNYSSDSEKV